MNDKTLNAPTHLRLETAAWWAEVVATWTLEAHHVRLLTLAAEAFDRAAQAREILDAEGLCVKTKAGGPRLHPAVRIEQDSRTAFARLIRELDLDAEAPPDASRRPPSLRSIG